MDEAEGVVVLLEAPLPLIPLPQVAFFLALSLHSSSFLYFKSNMPKEATAKKSARKAPAEKPAGRATKSKKDPNAPKRALSAYMFFSQDWRERVKAENPDAGFGEVGKLLGAKWKELDQSEKKPYIEQAARDKARAEQEKKNYEKKSGSGDDEEDDDED
ncbi:HMG-box [Pyrrhoderma noxium]|uniref:HMG-box n=1 Tax=Pyrrhoderma noxium TaxID=2282107 RepID=A0A286U7Z8_9AGAM|nr:HMG-box [Pyrrhoderma noxium]